MIAQLFQSIFRRQHDSEDTDPVFRLAQIFVAQALGRGADRLLIGMPPVDSPIKAPLTKQRSAARDPSERQQLRLNLYEDDCLRCGVIQTNKRSGGMPIWFCQHDGWELITNIPISIHFDFIEIFRHYGDVIAKDISKKCKLSEPIHCHVYLESNCHYGVRIETAISA
jgi:hypothetical protein